nr:AfsR/SARP family transcriptional regulator [Kitasatospora sp. MBT63]
MRFGLLGALTVHDPAGRELPLGAPKNRALLAVLLLRANHAVSLDTVKSALWGDHPPASATASVHNHVTRLRRALGDEGAARLRADQRGYRIEADEQEVDALVFTGLVRAADAARRRGDWAAVGRRSRAALALWRGDPLTGVQLAEHAAAQVEPELEQWRQSRLQVLEWRLEAELRDGEHGALVAELTALAAEHPLREGFHRQLMLALHRSGRQAEALAVFQQLRKRLVTELGVEPGVDARAAHREILAPPEDDPAPAPGPGAPAQLPRDILDFTGRSDQLDRLSALLAPTEPPGPGVLRVAAVSGPGGIGKTTLAVRAAHRIADGFPDGQLYVDLRGVHHSPADPGEVLAGFLRELGTPEHDIPATEEARAARYRSLLADLRVLVVLDNARDTAQVAPLLPGSAGCAALVTARRRLPGLAGAVHLDLSTLGDRDAHELFAAIAGPERAAAEPEATAEVVRHCAGLPLALRIAAARLAGRPSWQVATLADRLADHSRRLDELRVEDLAVRASFLMSYAQLRAPDSPDGPGPARAFRLLGLAPGVDIGLRAAAALLGQPLDRTEQVLEHLVDVSLLDSTGPDRYRLHDLLRDFAAERAEAEEGADAGRDAVGRIVRWYLDSLVEADAVIFPTLRRPERLPEDPGYRPHGFAGVPDALHWCDAERVNLVGATEAAARHGFHHIAWRIPGHGWSYLTHRSHLQDWLTTSTAGLAAARSAGDSAAESLMLTIRGRGLRPGRGVAPGAGELQGGAGDPAGRRRRGRPDGHHQQPRHPDADPETERGGQGVLPAGAGTRRLPGHPEPREDGAHQPRRRRTGTRPLPRGAALPRRIGAAQRGTRRARGQLRDLHLPRRHPPADGQPRAGGARAQVRHRQRRHHRRPVHRGRRPRLPDHRPARARAAGRGLGRLRRGPRRGRPAHRIPGRHGGRRPGRGRSGPAVGTAPCHRPALTTGRA